MLVDRSSRFCYVILLEDLEKQREKSNVMLFE